MVPLKTKQKVIEFYIEKKSHNITEISRILKISRPTVYKIIRSYEEEQEHVKRLMEELKHLQETIKQISQEIAQVKEFSKTRGETLIE